MRGGSEGVSKGVRRWWGGGGPHKRDPLEWGEAEAPHRENVRRRKPPQWREAKCTRRAAITVDCCG